MCQVWVEVDDRTLLHDGEIAQLQRSPCGCWTPDNNVLVVTASAYTAPARCCRHYLAPPGYEAVPVRHSRPVVWGCLRRCCGKHVGRSQTHMVDGHVKIALASGRLAAEAAHNRHEEGNVLRDIASMRH